MAEASLQDLQLRGQNFHSWCFCPSCKQEALTLCQTICLHADTASSLDQGKRKLGIWTKIKRRLSTESPGRCGPPESPLKSVDSKLNHGTQHSRGRALTTFMTLPVGVHSYVW